MSVTEELLPFERPIIQPPIGDYENGGHLTFLQLSLRVFLAAFQQKDFFSLSQFVNDLIALVSRYNANYLKEFCLVLLGSYLVFRAREWLSKRTVKFLLKRKLILPKHAVLFMESFFSLLIFLSTFTWTMSVESEVGYFFHPERLLANSSLTSTIELKVKLLFLFEAAYYVHYFYYSTALVGQWRGADFLLLAWHHFIVKALILGWYWNRTVPFGIQFWTLIECGGVLMTSWKCLLKLRFASESVAKWIRLAGFAFVLVAFLAIRLYFLPLKVIYPLALYMHYNPVQSWLPFTFINFVHLWILLLMNIYWSVFLLRILWRTINGGYREIEDHREDATEIKEKEKVKHK